MCCIPTKMVEQTKIFRFLHPRNLGTSLQENLGNLWSYRAFSHSPSNRSMDIDNAQFVAECC